MEETKSIGEILEEEIGDEIDNLAQLEPGTDEHSKAVESLTKLYKLRIEETKNELESEEKTSRRLMEKEQAERDAELKEKQLEADVALRKRELQLKESQSYGLVVDLAISIGVPLVLKLIDTIAYDRWYRRGLIFEETGSITSHMTKGLVSKMTPKR